MPSTIEQMHREHHARGLTILAVNIQEGRRTVARWVSEKRVTSRVLLDSDGSVTSVYRVTGTPTVVLVGRDGKMIGRGVGPRGWLTDTGRALLNTLLSAPLREK